MSNLSPRQPRRWRIVALIGGLFLALCLCCAGAGSLAWWWYHTPYTQGQFTSRFYGATSDEVRWQLGVPDAMFTPGNQPFDPSHAAAVAGNGGCWEYHGRTWNEKTERLDRYVRVWFTNDRCDQIQFGPP